MEDWLALLRDSPSFATRLLPPLASTEVTDAQGEDLERFLVALAERDRALAVDGLDLLAGDYHRFLREQLPRLLGNLRSLRSDQLAEVGPALAGQPVWGRTVLGWMSGALAADRMISRVPIRTLDLPENIALRLFLRHLAMLAGGIASRLGPRTHPKVVEIARFAEAALREPAVRAISEPGGASEQMLRAAEGAADPAYRVAGGLLRRRLALSGVDDLARWRRSAFAAALASTSLAPTDPEEIFELLALARVLDALERDLDLGSPRSFWMRIGSNARSGPVATFDDKAGGSVDIYFDRTPAFLLEDSTPYAEVFRRHEGLGKGADRRPDIVVVRHKRDRSRATFFLESKLPGADAVGPYLRESIYKAFGYLYDFASLWHSEQYPKVGLFVPSDSGLRVGIERMADLVVLSPRRPHDLVRAVGVALDFLPS